MSKVILNDDFVKERTGFRRWELQRWTFWDLDLAWSFSQFSCFIPTWIIVTWCISCWFMTNDIPRTSLLRCSLKYIVLGISVCLTYIGRNEEKNYKNRTFHFFSPPSSEPQPQQRYFSIIYKCCFKNICHKISYGHHQHICQLNIIW